MNEQELREQIASEIEAAHARYDCPIVALPVCSCQMAAEIARGK